MRAVYIAGAELCSALGPDLTHAMAQLQLGGTQPHTVALDAKKVWRQYQLIPPALRPSSAAPLAQEEMLPSQVGSQWWQQLIPLVQNVVQGACGERSWTPFRSLLSVASSSLDMGYEQEQGGRFAGSTHSCAQGIAAALAWRGPVATVSTACTSAVNAMLSAQRAIAQGLHDDVLVLGLEYGNSFSAAGFAALQLLAPKHCQPLGASRQGLVLGEAIAAVHLSARPARWRLAGGANCVDGRDPTGVQKAVVQAACEQALAYSQLRATNIDLIKLHAAGSLIGDASEIAALQALWPQLPPLSSFKAQIGHCLGASGAAELALLLACTTHHVGLPVDYAMDADLRAHLHPGPLPAWRYALLLNMGFGGGHAALVVEDLHA